LTNYLNLIQKNFLLFLILPIQNYHYLLLLANFNSNLIYSTPIINSYVYYKGLLTYQGLDFKICFLKLSHLTNKNKLTRTHISFNTCHTNFDTRHCVFHVLLNKDLSQYQNAILNSFYFWLNSIHFNSIYYFNINFNLNPLNSILLILSHPFLEVK
jgi:hypothetical protein